jgi:hypothetical protein
MGRTQDAVLEALSAELGRRTAWGERPGLHAVYLEDGEAHLAALPVEIEVWSSGATGEVLSAVADLYASRSGILRRVASPELFGAAFFSETRMAAQLAVPKLAGRKESRHIWAVDLDGVAYAAWQLRGGTEITTNVTSPGADLPMLGRVPQSLGRIVTAMTGVALPGRARL